MAYKLLLFCAVSILVGKYSCQDHPEYSVLDATIRVRSEGNAEYASWLQTDLGYVRLSVQACSNAHVQLGELPFNASRLHYEVVLGYQGNASRTVIRDISADSVLSQHDGTSLSCDSPLDIWISWTNTTITVGKGENVGDYEFVSATTEYGFTTRTVGLITSNSVKGLWTFHKDLGHMTQVAATTRDTADYEQFWYSWDYSHQPSLIFKVKMCDNARILQTAQPYDTQPAHYYEIRLENEKSTVYKDGSRRYDASTPNILSCSQFRYFWWSKRDGVVEFGSGSLVGENRIFSYLELDQDTKALSFSNVQLNEPGTWQISNIQGDVYTAFTRNDGRAYSELQLVTSHTYVEFSLRACTDAVMAFSSTGEEFDYFLVIGEDNLRSHISQVDPDNEDQSTMWKVEETPDILSCYTSRTLWVSWRDDIFRFGIGLAYINDTRLIWSPSDGRTLDFHSVALTTDDPDNRAVWTLNKHAGSSLLRYAPGCPGLASAVVRSNGQKSIYVYMSSLLRHTPGLPDWHQLWYETAEQTSLGFDIQACGDAIIQLPEFHGVFDYHTYELHLGLMKSESQYMRLSKVGSDHPIEVSMLQDLECSASHQYWVSWQYMDDGKLLIHVGDGPYPGQMSVLMMEDLTPYQINGAAITSSLAHAGTWTFRDTPDNMYVLHAKEQWGYQYGLSTVPGSWFQFQARATTNACFMVSSNTDYSNVQNGRSIEVCMGTNNNQETVVTDVTNNQKRTYESRNILSSSYFKRYWVELSSTKLLLGVGDLFSNKVVDYSVSTGQLDARFIHFKSGTGMAYFQWAKETHGLARFYTFQEVVPVRASIAPAPKRSYESVWVVSATREHVVFGVQACEEAHVELATLYGSDKFLVYEISLGIEGNNKTSIKGLYPGGFTRSLPTIGVLSCNEIREFWISWSNYLVVVGSGRRVGEDSIVTYDDLIYKPVQSYTFRSYGQNATWEFPEYEEDWFSVRTSESEADPVEIHTRQGFFDFEVQACAKATVKLQKIETEYYTVHIAEDNVNDIQIRKGGTTVHTSIAPDLVSCGELRKFWVSWTNNIIRIGTDWTPYSNQLTEWAESEEGSFLSDITSVHLLSADTDPAYWLYPKHSGNATVYTSAADGDYSGLRVAVRGAEGSLFRVKTCNTARLALSNIPAVLTERTLELVIEESSIILKEGLDGAELDSYHSGNLLVECETFKAYWLTWSDATLEIGQGHAVGDQRLLHWPLEGAIKQGINEIAVATSSATGVWQFSQMQSGDVFHAHTMQLFNWENIHNQVWVSRNYEYIQFAVRAETQARIALAKQPTNTHSDFYEIILGVNNDHDLIIEYTDSSGSRKEERRATSHALVSPTQYRDFWITWSDLQLKIGSGSLNSNLLTSSVSLRHDINGVSFSTGNLTNGDWTVRQDKDDSLKVMTRDTFDYTGFSFTLPDRTYFVFSVKVCQNADIILAASFGNEKTNAYRIWIGDDNTHTHLYTDIDSENRVSIDTLEILSCTQYRTFWVSWFETLAIGTGGNPGMNQVGEAPIESPKDVVQAFLDTGMEDIGYWELIDIQGNSYTVFTPNAHGYEFFWFRPDKQFFEFQVKACRDAHVALFDGPEYEFSTLRYEIVIGSGNNEKCQIRNASLSSKVANATTPQILNCDHFRSFWISWEAGHIKLGIGAANTHLLVEYRDVNEYSIDWLSLSTYDGTSGEFKFRQMQERELFVQTRDTGAHNQFWRTVMGVEYVTFRVKARSDVYILLSSIPLQEDTLSYQINIGVDGNTRTEIYRDNLLLTGRNTPDILNEDTYVEMWLSWADGYIRFGLGNIIYEQEKVSTHDSSYWVNALSLSAMMGVQPSWEFPHNEIVDPSTTTTVTPGPGDTSTTSSTTSTTTTSTTTTSTTTTTPPPGGTTTTVSSTTSDVDEVDPGSPSGDGGLDAGEIVGIVFGVLLGIMIIIVVLLVAKRYRDVLRYRQFEETAGVAWDNPNYAGDTVAMDHTYPVSLVGVGGGGQSAGESLDLYESNGNDNGFGYSSTS